jgi:hypothetical protein
MTSNYDFLKNQIIINFEIVFEQITDKNFELRLITLMLRDK